MEWMISTRRACADFEKPLTWFHQWGLNTRAHRHCFDAFSPFVSAVEEQMMDALCQNMEMLTSVDWNIPSESSMDKVDKKKFPKERHQFV
jgi:hypothetical protein